MRYFMYLYYDSVKIVQRFQGRDFKMDKWTGYLKHSKSRNSSHSSQKTFNVDKWTGGQHFRGMCERVYLTSARDS